MSDYKAIVRRESAPIAHRTLVPEEVSYSVSSDAVMVTRTVWTALRRQWRLALGIFTVVVLAVTAGTLLRPVNYRATGLLEIRPENAEAVPVSTLFGPQRMAGDSLATQIGIIQSVTLAERIVAEGLVDGGGESWTAFLNPMRWINGVQADDLQKKVQIFQEHLTVAPQEGSRLVRISYDASDPTRAADVVNAVLRNYLTLRVEETNRSSEWLSKQREDARAKLDASQRKLQAYVRQHGLQVLETGQGETENLVNDRLKQLHGQLIEAQAARYAQQSAYEQVNRQAGGGPAGGVSTKVTDDLNVRLADLEREAAGLSATFKDDYPRLQEVRKQIRAIETAIAQETQAQVTRAQRDYQAAMRREALIEGALERQQQTAQSLESSSAGYASLKREVTTDAQLYEALDQKLKEVSITGALKATNAGVLDPAKPPREPYQSPLTLNLALGVVLGLIGGVGGALMRNSSDNRVHRVEDVDGVLGVRAVAVIPNIPMARASRSLARPGGRTGESVVWSGGSADGGQRRWFQIGRGHQHRSVLADAFAALRSAVIFNQDSTKVRSLLITSPGVGDGKTTVSVNLALSLARLGNKVLLIDADMRHPSVHEALGMVVDGGLATYLAGQGEWWNPIQNDVFPNLAVMPAGMDAAEPADLLANSRMRELMAEAAKAYDYIVIDSPPLLPHLADPRILAELADGVLLTVRGGSTQRDVALRAVSQLHRVLGIVVNGFDMSETPPYYRETSAANAGAGGFTGY
jgi:capsular exopolysaccharide synthesis family protein